MFVYPTELELSTLETTSPEFNDLLPTFTKINDLYQGGHQLESRIAEYLPQRPSEDPQIYKHRLSKFLYINLLASTLNSQVSKLENGSLEVMTAESDADFWQTFRSATDLYGKRDEKELVAEILSECLKFKRVWLHVEKPFSPIRPTNKAQEEALGLRPYINLYPADQVIAWELEGPHKPKWVKLRQVSVYQESPLKPPLNKVTWTFIDNQSIVKYSGIFEFSRDGQIVSILDSKGEFVPINKDTKIPLESEPVSHSLGTTPLILAELPADLWVGDQVVNIALAHLRVSCHKHDLETFLYVQRTWKPQLTPDSDLSSSYVDGSPPPTGLQYVLQGGDFDWKEAEGKILPQLEKSLEQLEAQVRSLINQGGVSGSTKGAVEQSGLSKAFDFQEQEDTLKSYGTFLVDVLEDVYQLVARSQGVNPQLSVSGLNRFQSDHVDTFISQVQVLSDLNIDSLRANLPPILFKSVYSRLSDFMIGNLPPKLQAELEAEIEQMSST
jgi:hypothetical protein